MSIQTLGVRNIIKISIWTSEIFSELLYIYTHNTHLPPSNPYPKSVGPSPSFSPHHRPPSGVLRRPRATAATAVLSHFSPSTSPKPISFFRFCMSSLLTPSSFVFFKSQQFPVSSAAVDGGKKGELLPPLDLLELFSFPT